MVGGVQIGGDANISIQSMTNTDTRDIKATVNQIKGWRMQAARSPDFQCTTWSALNRYKV